LGGFELAGAPRLRFSSVGFFDFFGRTAIPLIHGQFGRVALEFSGASELITQLLYI
jgi:hypothetical protein